MPKYEISCKKRQKKFLRVLLNAINDYEFVGDIWTHSVKCEIILCGVKYIYNCLTDEFDEVEKEK